MRKFLVSTADVYGYDSSQNLVLVGKTLLDASIETTLANTDVRAGRGNQLQYIYYHTAEMNINIAEAQWNLDFLAKQVGQDVATGANIYQEETVTLAGGGVGTVVGTPLAVSGATIYGWATLDDGTVQKVTFTGKTFPVSGGSENDIVCVRYYALNSATQSLTIPSNFVPSILSLVLVAQLASSDSSTNIIGEVQIEVPRASMTGAFTISLTPDGVASTPLAVRALASAQTFAGCTSTNVYAKINEVIYNTNWYDNVVGLSIEGGDFALTHPATRQLVVRAIPVTGAAFIPPVADLTFSSGTVGTATISAAGLVTTVAAGTSLLKVTITSKATVDANVVVTVS